MAQPRPVYIVDDPLVPGAEPVYIVDRAVGPAIDADNWTPIPFTPPAFPASVASTASADGVANGQAQANTTGRTIELAVRVGVLSAPGQNGHIYLETAPANVGPWKRWGTYVACRNTAGNVQPVGVGGTVSCRIAPTGYWRWVLMTIKGYAAPTFINDGANSASFVYLD